MKTTDPEPNAMAGRAPRVFLLFAIVFGLAFALITPPFQVADEFNHFFRAYHFSEGGLTAERHDQRTGAFLPRSVWETAKPYRAMVFRPLVKQEWRDLRRDFAQRTDPTDRVFVDFPNTALYSPLPYAPQTLGAWLGRTVGAPPVVSLYLARLFALLAWTALTYAAIRIMPFHQWVLVVLALTPMSLFQGASTSADSITNSTTLLAFATIVRLAVQTGPIRGRSICLLFALTIAVSLCKAAYGPMVLLVAMIPAARFASRARFFGCFAAITLVNVVVVLGWAFVAGQSLVESGAYNEAVRSWQPFRTNASANAQVDWIVGNPVAFFSVLVRTFAQQGGDLAWSFVGSLGWLDAPIPKVSALVALISITLVALLDTHPNVSPMWRMRSVAPTVAVLLILLMTTYVYLNWSRVGAATVFGLQGRYFIPMAPMITIALANRRLAFARARLRAFVILHLAAFLLLATWTLIQRYYLT